MTEFKVITAKEARKLTEESNFYRKSVYKWIREAASRNSNVLPIATVDTDPDIMESILTELKENGYSVSREDEECYMVSW